MDIKFIRIAELSENISKVNEMISMHKSNTNNTSMISQYEFQRNEFIEELDRLFISLEIQITQKAIA
jgi:hypothetical protein